MKTTFFAILMLLATAQRGFSQTSIIADPAVGAITFTDLAGVPVSAYPMPVNVPVLVRIPIHNYNLLNEIPDGTMKIKIGLGSKMNIDPPGFDITTAALSDYFEWSLNWINGQWEIMGNLVIPLAPGFSDVAVFQIKPYTLGMSNITANVLVTNHMTNVYLSDEVPSNNNASLQYNIQMQNQTITFGALANQTYGDPPFALTATASSGFGVSYSSSDPAVATVAGNMLTIHAAGTTNITASQPGSGFYNPAPSVTQTLTVDPKNLTVTGASAQNKVYDATNVATIDLSGASLSGVVGSDIVTVSGNGFFAGTNVGTAIPVTTAFILGGAGAINYTISQLTLAADITQANQNIIFNPLPGKTIADGPFPLTATASSGLPVSYTSSDPSVATISGNVVTIIGLGSTVITASQPGDGNYFAATDVTQTLTVINSSTVNLKLFLQGYYIGGGMMQPVLFNQGSGTSLTETDSVTVELHDPLSPAAIVTSATGILQTNGTLSVTFSHPGGTFYIVIKHRNTVQTWSANPVTCTASTPLYDFSIASSQAFGNNQELVEAGVYAFYSGDLNQDEFIDSNDFPSLNLDMFNGLAGIYTTSDINGDGFVDGNDFPVYDANSFNGVTSIHP